MDDLIFIFEPKQLRVEQLQADANLRILLLLTFKSISHSHKTIAAKSFMSYGRVPGSTSDKGLSQ